MRWHIIITFACALHLVQALALYIDPDVVGVTSIFTIGRQLGASLAAATFLLVASLALWSQFLPNSRRKALLLIPQQLVLFISAAGAVNYIYVAHFADGVARSQAFIAADQSVTVLLAMGHFWAMVEIMRGNGHVARSH